VLIVTYHAIADEPSPVCATPAQLEADIASLLEARFTLLSLDDCADWLEGRRAVPERAAAITFDDGYASVVLKALPILQRLRAPATVYAIAGRIGGDNQWSGQWRSIPSMPLADLSQLRELAAAGVAIGSHSMTHPVLTEVPSDALRDEVETSADRLEQALQVPVRHFAYPYGAGGPREIEAARKRYRTASTANSRLVDQNTDRHDLGRVDCHDLRVAVRLRCLDETRLRPYLTIRRRVRVARRRMDRLVGRI
jgi:peptidoglycan/xylan/chitin deacetylase (PgdA/CDA1 family)